MAETIIYKIRRLFGWHLIVYVTFDPVKDESQGQRERIQSLFKSWPLTFIGPVEQMEIKRL